MFYLLSINGCLHQKLLTSHSLHNSNIGTISHIFVQFILRRYSRRRRGCSSSLYGAIHENAREIIILNSTGNKTNYLLLWRYPIKRISVTGQQNGSADRTVKHYRLAMFNVRYKTLLTFASDFAFLKTCPK